MDFTALDSEQVGVVAMVSNNSILIPSSFLFLVVRPGALIASLLLAMPFAPSGFLLYILSLLPALTELSSRRFISVRAGRY